MGVAEVLVRYLCSPGCHQVTIAYTNASVRHYGDYPCPLYMAAKGRPDICRAIQPGHQVDRCVGVEQRSRGLKWQIHINVKNTRSRTSDSIHPSKHMSINYYEHFPFGERKIKIRTTRLPLIIPVTECDRRTRQDMTMDMNKSYISCYYYYYTHRWTRAILKTPGH